MKWPVVVRRVVMVVPMLGHLVDEPAIHTLVEVGWFHVEVNETQNRRKDENSNFGPREL